MDINDIYKTLNNKEKDVYNYIIRNQNIAAYMNIRELAAKCNVSTTTILRFIRKLGLNSFKEFKHWCIKENNEVKFGYYTNEIIDCLSRMCTPIFNERIDEAVSLINECNFILFGGIGNSGGTALLGARCFSNFGVFSLTLSDPFYNFEALPNNMAVIMLSVSGETKELLEEAQKFLSLKIPIICITSNEKSTLGQISDLTLSYYISEKRKNGVIDMASQIPAVHIIELLANKIKK